MEVFFIKKTRIVFGVIYLITTVVASVINPEQILMNIGFLLLVTVPFLAEQLNVKIPKMFEIIYYVFVFAAVGLGSLFDFYNLISFYDLLLHTSFGFIGCFFGLYLFVNKDISLPLSTKLIFCFLVSMGFASLWEIYEFAGDVLFGLDSQKAIETGVVDTMEDMIVNAIGAGLFVLLFIVDNYKKRNILNKVENLLKV